MTSANRIGTKMGCYRSGGEFTAATKDFGLHYYVARWYDPVTAHFAQADTIIPNPGNSGDWNRYAYVLYNPIMFNDPSGNIPGDLDNPIPQIEGDDDITREANRKARENARARVKSGPMKNFDPEKAVELFIEMRHNETDTMEMLDKLYPRNFDLSYGYCTASIFYAITSKDGGGWSPENDFDYIASSNVDSFINAMKAEPDVKWNLYTYNVDEKFGENFRVGDIVVIDQIDDKVTTSFNHSVLVTNVNGNTIWVHEFSGSATINGRDFTITNKPIFGYVVFRIDEY